ncbi:M20 aminoacylase family protein [Snodgrassella alvi]|uniref:M20 aminoacylase family protein n=1 Tax=Snodgrassella alvi TaxID=1196083 RepID=UPI002149066E|nr:M20 aminoacylase family protein [Snodgrassella alvi]
MKAVREMVKAELDTFVQLRHDIHQHPELAFAENRTSDLVAGMLEQWGYQVEREIGGTGLVAQLRVGDGSKSVGIRADMDALPILEESGVAHSSLHEGKMHACGHDGHTTMLLAAAKVLASRKAFNGTLNLIFQPAEEYGKSGSGAMQMIADGLFEKYPCDAVYGMHNMPGYPQGELHFYDGWMMASSDVATITVKGVGGHGAKPHNTHDPIVAASSIVMALQTIVSRNVNPLDSAVVTVGMFHAGVANNVIPEQAELKLTVRCFKPEVRKMLQERIEAIAQAQAQSFNVVASVDYQHGYAPVFNTSKETQFARDVARDVVAEENIVDQTQPMAGSEDFAFMLEKCPGSYLFIGNGLKEKDAASGFDLHNPYYDFNDKNIAIGATYWVALAERFLK